jgi:hypothetical protein
MSAAVILVGNMEIDLVAVPYRFPVNSFGNSRF